MRIDRGLPKPNSKKAAKNAEHHAEGYVDITLRHRAFTQFRERVAAEAELLRISARTGMRPEKALAAPLQDRDRHRLADQAQAI